MSAVQTWEHLIVEFLPVGLLNRAWRAGIKGPELRQWLNDMGVEGWELVGIAYRNEAELTVALKRRLVDG